MLDAQTIATVKATIPLLVETGPKLTAHFYDRIIEQATAAPDIWVGTRAEIADHMLRVASA